MKRSIYLTITEITGYIVLVLLVYSVYIIPKAIGEYQGVFKEPADPFFGKMKEDCKWTHGMTFKSMIIGFIGGLLVMLIIQEQVQRYFGIPASAFVIFIILIPITIYALKKSKKNKIIAKNRNIEEEKISS